MDRHRTPGAVAGPRSGRPAAMLELAGRTYEDDSLRILGTTRRAYVIPELKLLYISLAKNAAPASSG